MFSLRHGVVALALSAFAISSVQYADGFCSEETEHDRVVGMASGVMAAFGSPTPEAQPAEPKIAVNPRTGQAVYLPTGEVVDEEITVRGTRILSIEPPYGHAAACEPAQAVTFDAGLDAATST